MRRIVAIVLFFMLCPMRVNASTCGRPFTLGKIVETLISEQKTVDLVRIFGMRDSPYDLKCIFRVLEPVLGNIIVAIYEVKGTGEGATPYDYDLPPLVGRLASGIHLARGVTGDEITKYKYNYSIKPIPVRSKGTSYSGYRVVRTNNRSDREILPFYAGVMLMVRVPSVPDANYIASILIVDEVKQEEVMTYIHELARQAITELRVD